ncbi:MAG: DnaJ domain-containing protein [Magnetococcus sp. DMHC-6]
MTEKMLDLLESILTAHPEGVREYALCQLLKKNRISPFFEADLGDSLQLFRIHFLLFHLLYLLRDRLRQQGDQDLLIHCLNISLSPWLPSSDSLPEPVDPLRAYYLDTSQLETVDRDQVEEMLAGFWRQLHRHSQRSEALMVLGLEESVTVSVIKSRYRELVKQHHPDQGGEVEMFHKIQAAAEVLLD